MSNELTVLENLNAVEVFVAGGTDKLLQAIRDEVINIIPDLTTKKGRDEIASRAAKVSKSKVFIIKKADVLKAELKAQLKPITLETTKVTNTLDALRKEVRLPLTQWEDAEKERIAEFKIRLAALEFSMDDYVDCDIEDIEIDLKQSAGITLNTDTYGGFLAEAEIALPIFIEKLTAHLNELKVKESDRLKLVQLEKEEAERKQKEREEQIARDAASKAEAEKNAAIAREKQVKIDAEEQRKQAIEDAIVAEAKAEWDKKEALAQAEDDKKQAAVNAELAKEAAIEAERQRVIELREANEKIAAKKAANKKHRTAVNRDALEDLEKLGFSEDDCKKIIIAIAKEQVRNITINY